MIKFKGDSNFLGDSVRCKICDAETVVFGSALVLSKYQVTYFQCTDCGFVQTEEPYWLDEAYSEAVSVYDLGSVNRAIVNSAITEKFILKYFECNSHFLDYGAGYGIFVRRMRDLGFNFSWNDKYCQNLFAKRFIGDVSGQTKYELLTAFEVFEHLVNPREELEKILSLSDNILFSTDLIPRNNPKPRDWWYYFPLHGQHISFYTIKTLKLLAESYSLHLTTDGKNIHLLTKRPLHTISIKDRILLKIRHNNECLRYKLNKQSLLMDDFSYYEETEL